MEKLADDFYEIVARHDLSDVKQRQVAVRYLSQQILNRKVFNDGRKALRRFSELAREAFCNQEDASALQQRLDDEPEPIIAQGEPLVL